MGTSIRDLIDTLHAELAKPPESIADGACDAARTLDVAGRMFYRLADQGLDPVGATDRGQAARDLGAACERAAATFTSGRGRCGDLVGALSDLVSIRRAELNRSDRLFVTLATGEIARAAAARIAASGPFEKTSALAEVRYRSTQIACACAAHAPVARRINALDRPVPVGCVPFERTTGQILADSVSIIVDTLREKSPVASAREIAAVAAAVEGVLNACRGADLAIEPTVDWAELRLIASQVIDGESRARENLRALVPATVRINQCLREPMPADELHIAASMMPALDAATAMHVKRSIGRWIIPVGERHLSEARVSEWLRHEAFVLSKTDIWSVTPNRAER